MRALDLSPNERQMPIGSTSAVDRLIKYATQLLREGQRPTLDLLVAHCGGSRTTAQRALTEFWEVHVPALLVDGGAMLQGDLPPVIRDALVAVWKQAKQEAMQLAYAEIEAERRTLKASQATLAAQLDAIDAERSQAARELERVQQQAAMYAGQRDAAQVAQQTIEDEANRLRTLLDQASTELENASAARDELAAQLQLANEAARAAAEKHRLETNRIRAEATASLTAARQDAAAAIDSIRLDHAKALDALKDAYHHAEQRLRLDLDTMRTDVKRLDRELRQARNKRAEAEYLAASLRVELAAAQNALKTASGRPRLRLRTRVALSKKKP